MTGEASQLVVVQGVSKMYAMTGFRIGWAVGNREVVEAMTNIQGHQTSGPVTVSQWAAVGAMSGVQTSIESLRLTLENQRNVMLERLQTIPGVHVTKPTAPSTASRTSAPTRRTRRSSPSSCSSACGS